MLRQWLPTPFLQTSAGVHVAAVAATLAQPPLWPWALGALIANHGLIATVGLLPRTHWLGPNVTHLDTEVATSRRAVALTFDDGPDPAMTPQVLDLLDEAGMKATFFCIGKRVQQHKTLARAILARGHAIGNHTQTHPYAFATYGPHRMARQILDAQASIADVCGIEPRLFRAVAGLRNPFLEPILAAHDLRLVSWTRRPYDTREADADTVVSRVTRNLQAGDILLMHDGHSARGTDNVPVLPKALPRVIETLRERDLSSIALDRAVIPAPTT